MTQFFDTVRDQLFQGRLNQGQVDGLNFIRYSVEDLPLPFAAYIFATAYHETARTMLPVRETLAGDNETAINRLQRAWENGRLSWVSKPYWLPDHEGKSWYGRGYVQLTHRYNYEKAERELGVPLVRDPDLALDPRVAADILVRGSLEGWFTGKSLYDYLPGDYLNARRVINGTDRARQVEDIAFVFEDALRR